MQKSANARGGTKASALCAVLLAVLAGAANAIDYEVEEGIQKLWHKAPIPTISVPLLVDAAKIDGVLDDAAWKQASEVSNFLHMRYVFCAGQEKLTTSYSLAVAETKVRIYRTAKALYVSFQCEEPEIEALRILEKGRDTGIWNNDCVELLLQPAPDLVYHFIVDPLGQVYDDKTTGAKHDRGWNIPDVEKHVVARVCKDAKDLTKSYWLVEMEIPFEVLGAVPKDGETWPANFCRERYAPGYKAFSEISSWTGVYTGFEDRSQFGRLVFSRVAVRDAKMIAESDIDHPFLGKNSLGFILENLSDRNIEVRATVSVTDSEGTKDLVDKVNFSVEKGKTIMPGIEYTVSPEGVGYASLRLYDGDLLLACARMPFKSERIADMLDTGLANAKALQARSDPQSDFAKSIGPYIQLLTDLQNEYKTVKADLLAKKAEKTSQETWTKLYEKCKLNLRAGNYLVWTCSPYIAVGPSSYPGQLADAPAIKVNACRNEYENAVVNITNLTGEDLDFWVEGNIPFPAGNPRTNYGVPIRQVLTQHPALGWGKKADEVSPQDDGLSDPLLDILPAATIHVRPYSTRQIWYTTYTKDAKPGKYASTISITPLSHNIAGKTISIELNVWDFEIPDEAQLGTFCFNYVCPYEFLRKYKINIFFWTAWPNPKIEKDGKIVLDWQSKRVKDEMTSKGARKFLLSYGYTGSFIDWAKKQNIAYMSDEWKRLFKAIFKQYVEELKAAGIGYDDFVIQTIDEAHGHQVDQVCETTPLLREADPKVQLAMTVMATMDEMKRMSPHVDVWLNRHGDQWTNEFEKGEKAKGKRIWSWHMAGDVKSQPITWMRTYGWRAEYLGFEAIGYFIHGNAVYRWDNPISTRQMEAWRDGIEDWQYFHALHEALDKTRAKNIEKAKLDAAEATLADVLKSVLQRPKGGIFPENTQELADAIEAARAKLAAAILELNALTK